MAEAPFKSLEILEEMKKLKLQPNVTVYNILIAALFKSKKPALAMKTFRSMKEEQAIEPNITSFLVIIEGYCNNNKFDEAIEAFEEMKQTQIHPNEQIYTHIICALCTKNKEQAVQLLESAIKQ